MSTGNQDGPAQTLYDLLPAIYRIRDALQPGHPLSALLTAIEGQVDELAADIGHQYDNWFIETCDDDLLPYFAGLVGLTLGPSLPASAHAANPGADSIWRRAQVADAITDRSRKGSFSVLEQLAAQATGWPARAIEIRQVALATQSVRMPDIGRRRLTDLADMQALELLPSPWSEAAPLTDVRRLSSHRTRGTVNPSAVAVWLWRLVAERVRHAPAASADEENRYKFDQLGRDLPLAVIPAGGRTDPPATDLDVAGRITRRALRLRLEDYYGPARSICVYRGGRPVPRQEILVADLSRWRERTPPGRVAIDPVLGRIAFPVRHPPDEEISVTCAHLGIGAIGGGSYQRPLPVPTVRVYHVGPRGHASIRRALQAWRAANEHGEVPAAVIEIDGDGVYREHLDIRLAAGEQLEIRAAQGRRPVIIPVEPGGGRPDRFRVRGTADPDTGTADGQLPSFAIDGVWIARHSLDLYGGFASVRVRHCTLVPARGLAGPGSRQESRRPSLVVRAMPCPIAISSSVVGTILVESPETGFEPLPLKVCDSVLDASDLREPAVLGTDDRPAWVRLSLSRVTVLGGADVHSIGLAEDSILTGALDCERRQTGHVRFCYLAPGSHTPKRTSCQPDDPLTAARVIPRFDSVQFGQPAYARLAAHAAPELTHGAHDEGELGAYHDLWQPLRAADLRTRLREYVPPGVDIDIRFATLRRLIMNGDFSRLLDGLSGHFSGVLAQQGRLVLDSELNEQNAILLDYLRCLTTDLIGPFAGPIHHAGFEVEPVVRDGRYRAVRLRRGRYYVYGLRCEAPPPHQPANREYAIGVQEGKFVVYLVVWEQSVSAIQAPELIDPALPADVPDTTRRRQVRWRPVAGCTLPRRDDDLTDMDRESIIRAFREYDADPRDRPTLAARPHSHDEPEPGPATAPVPGGYRGVENQLYRVEVYRGGRREEATFVWSRDNGCHEYGLEALTEPDGLGRRTATLRRGWSDTRQGLEFDDWVELVDDNWAPLGTPAPLLHVKGVSLATRKVTLQDGKGHRDFDPMRHPLLRRWDQWPNDDEASLGIPVREADRTWFELEDGVEIRFDTPGAYYERGDYWMIPARTGTTGLLWPQSHEAKPVPLAVHPHGPARYLAPLALVHPPPGEPTDLRTVFEHRTGEHPPPDPGGATGSGTRRPRSTGRTR
jgi:hypothetical protein